MTKEQELIKNWMKDFKQETKDSPSSIDESTTKLRASLILEEALETITKGLGLSVHFPSNNPDVSEINEMNLKEYSKTIEFYKEKEIDIVEVADGLADLHVVGYCGTASAMGIDMEPIFNEVHRSNSSKLWKELEIEECSSDRTTVDKISHDKFLVKNLSGKVIKSPSYSPAKIKEEIEKQIKSA